MTKLQALFKTLVTRGLKEPRSAVLLIKIMEQYDLVKDEPIEGCIRSGSWIQTVGSVTSTTGVRRNPDSRNGEVSATPWL
jgi:hypothetical protein